MKSAQIASVFGNTVTEIFHYPPKTERHMAVLILKGLYGEHVPHNAEHSWNIELISLLQHDHHVFLINTGRRSGENRTERFAGKTYRDECADIMNAYTFINSKMLSGEYIWEAVAMSFGGTLLLGLPEIMNARHTLVFIGSGCGKSATTTKPILSTLPETEILLDTMSRFSGNFFFLHGELDDVVPLSSQQLIYDAATRTKQKEWKSYPNLDHELRNVKTGILETPQLAATYIKK